MEEHPFAILRIRYNGARRPQFHQIFVKASTMGNGIDQALIADWPYPRLVAHRIGGKLAPENTLAGFEMCARFGYKMIEFDAKLSSDDQIFLLHDDDLDRTTNGHGPAAQHTWHQLASLDAGAWFDPRFADERLPTLSQVAARCTSEAIAANIEIKPCPGRDEITGRLVALAAKDLWRAQKPLLSSFSFEALKAARDAAPSLPRGMLFEALPDDWLAIVRELGCVSLHADHKHLTQQSVRAIRDAGLRMLAYTVNDPARARELAKWGVDMICTDRLDMIGADVVN
jgi:glycerophosphoryl diester phosphodiesterase